MKIIEGKADQHPRVLIFGRPGIGKSTWACRWPSALAADGEDGLDQIGPKRFKMGTFDETLDDLRLACSGKGEHRTVVVDTLDALERRAIAAVCAKGPKGKPVDSLADFGYGDGYTALLGRWREFQSILETAREMGRSVVCTAHMRIETIDDPRLGKHGAWVPRLDKRLMGAMTEWSDAVLYACDDAAMHEGRAILTGERKLVCVAQTGIAAKNRWNLPPELPLDYAAFAAARAGRTAEDVKAAIRMMASDPELARRAESFIHDAGNNVQALVAVETALKEKVGG